MIGLEFALRLQGYKNLKVAEMLGIHKVNVTFWLKGDRLIPDKHLEKLSNYFNVPNEILQKHITEEDKKELVRIYIGKLSEQYNINVVIK